MNINTTVKQILTPNKVIQHFIDSDTTTPINNRSRFRLQNTCHQIESNLCFRCKRSSTPKSLTPINFDYVTTLISIPVNSVHKIVWSKFQFLLWNNQTLIVSSRRTELWNITYQSLPSFQSRFKLRLPNRYNFDFLHWLLRFQLLFFNHHPIASNVNQNLTKILHIHSSYKHQ